MSEAIPSSLVVPPQSLGGSGMATLGVEGQQQTGGTPTADASTPQATPILIFSPGNNTSPQLQEVATTFNVANISQGTDAAESFTGTTSNDLFIANGGDDVGDGGAGDDKMFAGDGDDRMTGGAGKDLVHGNQGEDFIDGGIGDDEIYAGQDDDSVLGGDDNDLLYGNKGDDTLDGGTGDDTVYGGQDNDSVLGGAGADLVFGDKGNDIVSGGDGNDQVYGGTGDDSVSGDAGDDTVHGGQGNDSVSGGAGNDVVFGDRGNDIITGGEGADKFRFEYFPSPGESVPAATAENGNPFGVDTLTDFTPGQDKIQLDRRVFPALPVGALAANMFAISNGFNANNQGTSTAKAIYDSTSGLVYYNPTGTPGDEVSLVQLQPNLNPSASDFEIF
ncbi:MAG: calcium-binding protein [Oscillatoriaceae cyanobacterium]